MPGATPNFAIPYPCPGDVMDCAAFEDWAVAIQDAVSAVATAQTQALHRPAARFSNITQPGVAVNVTTNLTYSVEVFDNDNMISLGALDRITITTPGIYLVTGSVSGQATFTTLTSQALTITNNATTLYRSKDSTRSNTSLALHVIGLINCAAADVLRLTYLWTGTGGPSSVNGANLSARLVARV